VTAHLLWLSYMLPNLHHIADTPFVVADYDILMADPVGQLERIAGGLRILLDDTAKAAIREFANDFLEADLRHSFFNVSTFDTNPQVPPLTRESYLWLRRLATDRIRTDSAQFWTAWESTHQAVRRLIANIVCA
jgi:hypothetical protein